MRQKSTFALIFLAITSCEMFGITDAKEPCPPSISSSETNNSSSPKCQPIVMLSFDTDAAWSPDGKTVAFSGTEIESFGIHFINADGTNRRLFHAGIAGAPAWSPDGQWVAFFENAHIFKKHVESDSLVQLTISGRNFHPDWSPDGERIAYDRSIADESGPSGVWTMNSDGTEREYSFGAGMPVWHPEEDIILAVRGAGSQTSIWKRFILRNLTGTQQDIMHDAVVDHSNMYPKFSPDGSRILFESQPGPGSKVKGPWLPQIWVMNSDGSVLKQLTTTGGLKPAWSSDGQWVTYTETRETGRLWLMRPDGSEKHQLTFN